MAGCGKAEPPPIAIPPVVDLASVRCPPIDDRLRAEFRRKTPRPALDTADTDGTPGLSRAATRGWIDRLELSEDRKNAAGLGVIDSYERCTSAAAPVAAVAPITTAAARE